MIKTAIILLLLFITAFNSSLGQSILIGEKCLTQNDFEDRYASYSPDGNWIVFESNREGNWQIFIMDSKGGNQQQVTTNQEDNRRPSWHPLGEKILFESNRDGKFELYTISLKKRKVKKLLTPLENGEMIFASYPPMERILP